MPTRGALSRRAALRAGGLGVTALALGALAACQPSTEEARPVPGASQPTQTPYPTFTPFPTATQTFAPTAIPEATAPAAFANSAIRFTEHGDLSQASVAITIDDFLYDDVIYWWMADYLRENTDVKMSMFPVGNRLKAVDRLVPGIWNEWLDAGHVLAWHSMDHLDFGQLTADDLRRDIDRFNSEMAEVLGLPGWQTRYARATYGNYGEGEHFAQVADEYGITWVLWNRIPSHSRAEPLEHEGSIQNGDIALFHVRWQDQYWIERYVEFCRERGFAMLSLEELVLTEA